MTRERGDWIPWYCEDSPGWVELSFAARGVAEGVARKMGPKRNALHLGHRGLRGLCRLLHGRWEEFEPAMRELLSPGPDGEPPRLVYDAESGTLSDPQHEDRRRRSSADRMRSLRDRARDECDASDVTPVTVTPSDGGDAPSPLLSSPLISSSSREGEPERETAGVMRPLREDEPLTEKRRKYVQTVNDNKGSRLDVEETWRNFVNDRISRSLLFGSHGAVDADWRKWVDREAKWFLERLGDKRDHKARMEKRYGDHVPKYEKPTGQQASNFQAELKKRLEEEAKKGAA